MMPEDKDTEKKKIVTMDDITEKKDKEEREKIKSAILQDVGDVKKKIGQEMMPNKNSKLAKDLASLYKWVKRIIIFMLVNLVLFNIWAVVTLIKAIIGWFA